MRRDSQFKNSMISDILILIGSVALFSFAFRFWPIFLLCAIVGFWILVINAWRYIIGKKRETDKQEGGQVCDELPKEPSALDVLYTTVVGKINTLVKAEYPNAVWVWKKAFNVKNALKEGKELVIVLNKAGGYRLAKVNIKNDEDVVLEYITAPEKAVQEKPKPNTVEDIQEDIPINYGLMAFSWVESHVNELNDHCNEAIGKGQKELILTSEELPVKESWSNCCEELIKAGLKDVEQIPEGIKIILLR